MQMERDENETHSNQPSGAASLGAAHSAYEPVADAGSSLREKAGGFKNAIADALESGAEKLRKQAPGETGTTSAEAGGSFVVASENRLGQTSNQLAGGMQGAADWLRDADLDGLKEGIERQVKEHPGRSLAIAVGVGYLLGKAFRRQ
jgi:ElaB/YqjD/DUF883 family membrane-anchored ribosome-binding protein